MTYRRIVQANADAGNTRLYRDALGLSHLGLSELAALRLRNERLTRELARALEQRCERCKGQTEGQAR